MYPKVQDKYKAQYDKGFADGVASCQGRIEELVKSHASVCADWWRLFNAIPDDVRKEIKRKLGIEDEPSYGSND